MRAEPLLLPCKCQVSASGALSVPEHPSALRGPSPSVQADSAPVPGANIPPASTAARSPSRAGSRDRDSVTPRGCAGWGPSAGQGRAVGTTGTAEGGEGALQPQFVSQFPSPSATLPSQSGNQETQPDWEYGPRDRPPKHPLRFSPPGAAAGPLRPPSSPPGSLSPSPPKAPTPELHEIRLRAADKAPRRNKDRGAGMGPPGSGKSPGNGVAGPGTEAAEPRVPPQGPCPTAGSVGTQGQRPDGH